MQNPISSQGGIGGIDKIGGMDGIGGIGGNLGDLLKNYIKKDGLQTKEDFNKMYQTGMKLADALMELYSKEKGAGKQYLSSLIDGLVDGLNSFTVLQGNQQDYAFAGSREYQKAQDLIYRGITH